MRNAMVGFVTTSPFRPSLSIALPTPFPSHTHHSFPFSSYFTLKPQSLNSSKSLPFLVFAANNNNGLKEKMQEQEEEQPNEGDDEDDDASTKRRPILSFNWKTLLDPGPDNVLALGLTALLTWASAQVLLQLLLISVAILVAAIKYSFIAALLIFILITLL